MPHEAQPGAMGQPAAGAMGAMGGAGSDDSANRPGGGIGVPIDTPDPLSKYKWWILGAMTLMLAAGAGYLLRSRGAFTTASPLRVAGKGFDERLFADYVSEAAPTAKERRAGFATSGYPSAPAPSDVPRGAGGNSAVLNILKEELFAIESEKLNGTLSASEYADVKMGLEAVLKRALKTT